MYTLIISISCSVSVSILLKLAKTYRIDVAQAIAANYVIAALLCLILLQPSPVSLLQPSTPWWVLIALGILLPTIFLTMAAAVRHAGIVLSDAAQRLSLLIPLLASFFLFGEVLSPGKIAGISLALIALVLLLTKPESNGSGRPAESFKAVAALLSVWLGYGVIDILFKQLARHGAAFSSSLLVTFILAGIIIFSWLLIQRTAWNRRSLIAGLILGLLNFGNIYFYIRAHQRFPDNPTLVFSAMNIGVIATGTLVGAGIFKERLNLFNIVGVALAICAIILLIPR